jgi:diguanylate cyclase (GGDEF)-like protein
MLRDPHEQQLTIYTYTQIAKGQVPLVLGTVLIAAMLHDLVAPAALGVWMAVAALNSIERYFTSRAELRRAHSAEADPGHMRRAIPRFALFGLVWGSLAPVAAEWGEPEAVFVTVVMQLAIMAMFIVTSAAVRAAFLAGMVGFGTTISAGLLMAGGIASRLAIAAAVYFAIAWAIHDGLHRRLSAAIKLGLEHGALAAQLREQLAERDPLTGLANRRSFVAALDALVSSTTSGELVTVAVGDVRQLSSINDLYGETTGNHLLVELGRRLTGSAGDDFVVARLGGNEFAVASSIGPGDDRRPRDVLRHVIEDVFAIGAVRLQVEMHVGEATTAPGAPAEQLTGDSLLADAMARMRVAKARQRSEWIVSVGMSAHHRELSAYLGNGLEAAGIEPWFQPIFGAVDRDLVGWEALVRWRHADHGLLPPADFLPLIVIGGRHEELLDVVLRKSLEFLASLPAGAEHHVVHVNVTGQDLRRPDLVARVGALVEISGVAADRLVIELTEQDILDLDDNVRANLAGLDAAGIRLAVDDFGTGYSSLSHLLDLPTRQLKIDHRFIAEIEDHDAARSLVTGVISLAHGLDMTTTAEGVETEHQAELLTALGCGRLQGFLFAPALAPDDARRLIATHAPVSH